VDRRVNKTVEQRFAVVVSCIYDGQVAVQFLDYEGHDVVALVKLEDVCPATEWQLQEAGKRTSGVASARSLMEVMSWCTLVYPMGGG
jgi:hypothetical protein